MAMTLKQRAGLHIKTARRARGLTQEQLAELIGCAVETVSNAERGKSLPRLEMLAKIGQRLGVPLGKLLDVDDGPGRRDRNRLKLELCLTSLLRQLPTPVLEIAMRQVEALASHAPPQPRRRR